MKAILTFHSVDDSGSVLSYPPAAFAALLRSLDDARLPVRDLDTLLAPATARGVALTFDDGMASLHAHARPVLREHGVPSHLFLATATVGGTNRWDAESGAMPSFPMLDWDQVAAMQQAGMRIESHTHTHPDLRGADAATIDDECEEADRLIEARTGRRPAYFAYPFGRHDARARERVRARYRASVTVALGELRGGEDPAALPRLDTYYLRAPWMYRNLEGLFPRAYLRMRAVLRRVRGSE